MFVSIIIEFQILDKKNIVSRKRSRSKLERRIINIKSESIRKIYGKEGMLSQIMSSHPSLNFQLWLLMQVA